MKELFPGYYRPSPAKLEEMWSTGIISLDTNVLLDVFRVSDATADQLLSTLEQLHSRLWLPYHVAKEYHTHVDSIVADQVKPYDEAMKRMDVLLDSFGSTRNHPFLDDTLLAELRALFSKLNTSLRGRRDRMERLLSDNPLKERIATLFTGRIGEPLSAEDLDRIYQEGAQRFDSKVPPGYADKKDKPEPQRYGDLVIWESLIAKLVQENKPSLFVTSEVKEDWFLRISGKTVGPRPELISEMRSRAGVDFFLYATPAFLSYANEFLNAGVQPEAIREVQDLQVVRRQRFHEMHRASHLVRRTIAALLGPDARVSRMRRMDGKRYFVHLDDGQRLMVDLADPANPTVRAVARPEGPIRKKEERSVDALMVPQDEDSEGDAGAGESAEESDDPQE
jgi:hypothetical protein